MKNHFLLFGLLLATLSTHAQSDWQLFRPGVQYLYEYPDADHYVESPVVGIKLGADTCTEMYPSLRWYLDQGIFDCHEEASSFMGHEVCQTEELTRLRVDFDAYVHIRQKAAMGEVWPAYAQDGDTIWAKVTAIQIKDFLGLADSVKTVFFYRQGNGGQPEYVPTEYRPLLLSKHYGLISTFSFRDFPHFYLFTGATSAMPLIGLSEPETGLQNIGWEDVFDLQVGDESHIVRKEGGSVYSNQGEYLGGLIRKTFQKAVITDIEMTTSPQQLTVSYDAQVIVTKSISAPTNTYEVFPIQDTSYIVIYELAGLEYLNLQPGELFSPYHPDEVATVLLGTSTLCGKAIKGYGLRLYKSSDNCIWLPTDGTLGPFYIEDMGGAYYDFSTFSIDARDIVYFQRDSLECGTPLDFDQITTTEEAPELPQIILGPNPTSGALLLQLPPDFVADLKLYDAYGRLVLSENQSQGTVEWSLGALPAGTYRATAWQAGRLVWQRALMKL